MKLNKNTLLFSLILMVSAACFPQKGYEGPTRLEDQIVIVRARGVDIHRVDTVERPSFGNGVAILPGYHELVASFSPSNFLAPDNIAGKRLITFIAHAGREYEVVGSASEGRGVCIWVEEAATKKRVSNDPTACGTPQ